MVSDPRSVLPEPTPLLIDPVAQDLKDPFLILFLFLSLHFHNRQTLGDNLEDVHQLLPLVFNDLLPEEVVDLSLELDRHAGDSYQEEDERSDEQGVAGLFDTDRCETPPPVVIIVLMAVPREEDRGVIDDECSDRQVDLLVAGVEAHGYHDHLADDKEEFLALIVDI